MYKFKTMYDDANTAKHADYIRHLLDTNVPMTKMDHEMHVIPLGHFLRKTHLDELPQLYNVLRGDMSLVGPRPDVPYAVEKYAQWYCSRHDVAPGMTGLWQVRGKNETTYEEMMRLDIQYVSRRSPLFDLMILTMTVPTIAKQAIARGVERRTTKG
jgi:undecaprenyl-phosphate galactose phosphotransferase